eukprot:scaffold1697_cov180-Amphora_coffeaeformis.AAC.20
MEIQTELDRRRLFLFRLWCAPQLTIDSLKLPPCDAQEKALYPSMQQEEAKKPTTNPCDIFQFVTRRSVGCPASERNPEWIFFPPSYGTIGTSLYIYRESPSSSPSAVQNFMPTLTMNLAAHGS